MRILRGLYAGIYFMYGCIVVAVCTAYYIPGEVCSVMREKGMM